MHKVPKELTYIASVLLLVCTNCEMNQSLREKKREREALRVRIVKQGKELGRARRAGIKWPCWFRNSIELADDVLLSSAIR